MNIQSFLENLTILNLLIVILGNWRICSLVANENGPWYIFKKFRDWCLQLCKKNKWCNDLHLYELVTCEWCSSAWFCTIAVIAWYLSGDVVVVILLPLALSACVVFVKLIIQNLESLQKFLSKLSS